MSEFVTNTTTDARWAPHAGYMIAVDAVIAYRRQRHAGWATEVATQAPIRPQHGAAYAQECGKGGDLLWFRAALLRVPRKLLCTTWLFISPPLGRGLSVRTEILDIIERAFRTVTRRVPLSVAKANG